MADGAHDAARGSDDPPMWHRRIRPVRATSILAALGATAILAAGCGGGHHDAPRTSATAPPPSAPAGPPSAVQVIRRWADTLRRGDVAGASRQFALPTTVQIDPAQPAVRLTRRAQVQTFNRLLPCGATLIRTERRGAYVEALFRLVNRPGATCDGPGATARTAFRVRAGAIVEWRRRLDEPGDARARPTQPPAGGGAPTV
jgi:limonene-1,2-epoxide hydrolase